MAESFEPKCSISSRLMDWTLKGALTLAVLYLVFWHPYGDIGETISPSEMRKVIANFRAHRQAQLELDTENMRKMLTEMKQIRDKWVGDAGINEDISAVLTEAEREFRSAGASELASLQLDEVYDVGRSVEQDMITVYREFLAARTVGLRPGLTYEEAYEASATPRPTRPELNNQAIYRDITTTAESGGLAEFKAEMKKSTVEMREMLEHCKKLLAFTRKSSSQTGDGLDVDITADDLAMIDYRGPELLPDELDFTHEYDLGNFECIPGRRLVTGGHVSEWMYVDSWYIIGPFPGDRRRQQLDVRFGPEANVNLDDIYTGKDNRKIPWEYKKTGFVTQSDRPKTAYWKIEPKLVDTYAIYYAFTEIYSDLPREVWIATGTDDYGKLWVNDALIWRSPKERKPYNATENIQLANFKQGQNKVLYRVENAGGTMGFSLMLRLAE